MERQEAWQQAENKMREAEKWRAAFDGAVKRFRYYRVLYAARGRRFKSRLKRGSISPMAAYAWQRTINEACDMMIVAQENIHVCAKQVRSAQMDARIKYEEAEERELVDGEEAG